MRPRSSLLGLSLLLSSVGCATESSVDDEGTNESETAECDVPTLELRNNTGNTIEIVHFDACDMSDGHDFPIPPPGLANGESTSIPFPDAGCWVLSYEGEGCFSMVPEMPGDLACGDSYAWTPDDSNHICEG
jgi:hypothetical protein